MSTQTQFPFQPIAEYRAHEKEILTAMKRVADSGHYILGPEVTAFEKEFAAELGASHMVGCANGTDALVLALRALDIGAGDTVITVSHTAVATVATAVCETVMTVSPAPIPSARNANTSASVPFATPMA